MTGTMQASSISEGVSDLPRRNPRPCPTGEPGVARSEGGARGETEIAERGDACCEIVGNSTRMCEVKERIKAFAQHTTPVLITGETGTGKEMVSRALHRLGPRAERAFVPVACGAIPTELAESELLGHERGAFTGAVGQRMGAFERADGGTLLLDDVDDLPLGLQVKILRALEEQSFLRVGGSREVTVNVRVIATSKKHLGDEATEGRFRQDLYYRLRALEIRMPALRERGDDVLLLAEHFIRTFETRHAGKEMWLGTEAARFRDYAWPGNVRELRHAIESTVIACPGGQITPECLPDFLRRVGTGDGADVFTVNLAGLATLQFTKAVRAFEDRLLCWAMQRAHGQQSKAAEILGLPRTTLQSKLSRLHKT